MSAEEIQAKQSAEIALLKETIEAKKKKIKDLKQSKEKLEDELQALKKQQTAPSAQSNENHSNNAAQEREKSLQVEISNLKEQLRKSEEEVRKMKDNQEKNSQNERESARQITSLKEQLAEKEREIQKLNELKLDNDRNNAEMKEQLVEKEILQKRVQELEEQARAQKSEIVRLEQELERASSGKPRDPLDKKVEALYSIIFQKVQKRVKNSDLEEEYNVDAALVAEANAIKKSYEEEYNGKVVNGISVRRSQKGLVKVQVAFLRKERRRLKKLKNTYVIACNKHMETLVKQAEQETVLANWEPRLDQHLRGRTPLGQTPEEIQQELEKCEAAVAAFEVIEKDEEKYAEDRRVAEEALRREVFDAQRALKAEGYGIGVGNETIDLLRKELEDEMAILQRLDERTAKELVIRTLITEQEVLFPDSVYGPRTADPESLPQIVIRTIDFLEERALHEEHILGKENYKPDKVKQIKHYFDQGPIQCGQNSQDSGYDVDLSKCGDYFIVGELLKSYFRELPSGLLAPVFEEMMQLRGFYCQFLSLISTDIANENDRITHIRKTVTDLPRENKVVLGALIVFLAKLSRKSALNKMTVERLAAIFGDYLLHP